MVAAKRQRLAEDATAPRSDGVRKRQKRGFVVGPDNLPDGSYKRKTQRIKKALIERAQIKQEYAKLKRDGKVPLQPERLPKPASEVLNAANEDVSEFEGFDEPCKPPHPDRQTLMDTPVATSDPEPRRPRKERKPKPVPFQREYEQAQRRQAEAEERRRAREESERQRQTRLEEREKFRKAMAKARTGGPNGQRKLGRESNVLLEKVKRMVSGGG